MGRKRRQRALDIYVGSSKVGQYTRAANGLTTFRYSDEWLSNSDKSFPISMSMPLSNRIWSGDQVNSYFDGLLPDDQTIREKIAAREHAEGATSFDLLAVLGRDCVGALRFIPGGEDSGSPSEMQYRPISDDEIVQKIEALGASPLGVDIDKDDFRISIAGMQEKTAFLKIDGEWQIPLGATPTSHIFKPAMKGGPNGADFSDTSWNEWFCLKLCNTFGLNTAEADVRLFDNKPVIIVERFDRVWRDGTLYRIPQEDLCQATGVSPTRKYQNDGGLSMVDILGFLDGAADPKKDKLTLLKAQIVFWLLSAIDGHAKNFSIFLTPGGYELTPLYDVMSAAPYPELSPHKIKLAMSAGDNRHYRIKEILPRHFYQTAKKGGLSEEDMDAIFGEIKERLGRGFDEEIAEALAIGMPEACYASILDALGNKAKRLE
ncbi:MAG: serine/threonine-protein kinase HipA [Gammaproteobacteria bacterium]|jgi:serine/threonine-protein kinase HipA